ncbi:MAG: hypothetical protein U5R31_04770 [Acidimicrobiia bacterium]|nr:hypothetical protein [Acidimicrobiia bacterium]
MTVLAETGMAGSGPIRLEPLRAGLGPVPFGFLVAHLRGSTRRTPDELMAELGRALDAAATRHGAVLLSAESFGA